MLEICLGEAGGVHADDPNHANLAASFHIAQLGFVQSYRRCLIELVIMLLESYILKAKQ